MQTLGKLVHRKPVAQGNDKRLLSDGIPALADYRRRRLLMLGFVGLALRERAVEAEIDDMASRPSLRPSSLRPKVLIARRSLRSRKGIGGSRNR